MCAIVGCAGPEPVLPILLEGLTRLEYRGYDSAGIALQTGSAVWRRRRPGKLAELVAVVDDAPEATTGIGHTRWATHGGPSESNAHPHTDCTGRVAVVHNGIIENYLELRERLIAAGHRFCSETDTEVLPHLIEHHFRGDLEQAIREALAEVRGSYAVAVVSSHDKNRLYAARKDSPLVIGLGDG